MKTGIIDVGGGFRDIYGCGVLDVCLEEGISFDYCIGVSAGSANLSAYLAGQKGRNYRFYAEYGFRKEYASLRNYLLKRNFFDMNYVYGTLSNSDGEYPLDFQALMAHPAEFYIVACNAATGEPAYLTRNDMSQDHYEPFMASSAIPVVCKPYPVNGILYYDGGIADPIPLKKAFADGCDRVVLILTKPVDLRREAKADRRPARMLRRKYPKAAERLANRYQTYNDGVDLAKRYAEEGKVLIIAPDDCCGVTTISRTPQSLKQLYQKGRRDACLISEFLARH